MPRKRMIHPEFFTSGTLSRLDFRTMLTFAGLWIYADDYGRGEDDPAFVSAAVWPRRAQVGAVEVEEDLDALSGTGTLCRYQVGGAAFLHIPSWLEHQRVSHPTPSKLPPCPRCEPVVFTAWWKDDDTATDRFRKAEKEIRAARRNDSGPAPTQTGTVSGAAPEPLASRSGATHIQSSSVQGSAAQGPRREFHRKTA